MILPPQEGNPTTPFFLFVGAIWTAFFVYKWIKSVLTMREDARKAKEITYVPYVK